VAVENQGNGAAAFKDIIAKTTGSMPKAEPKSEPKPATEQRQEKQPKREKAPKK
jgi:hypothetical protein